MKVMKSLAAPVFLFVKTPEAARQLEPMNQEFLYLQPRIQCIANAITEEVECQRGQ